MPLTFRKSFQVLPGVKLNINRKSWSVTTGGKKGPRRTVNSNGRQTTSMDLPGPFGYRHTTSSKRSSKGDKLKMLSEAVRGKH
ncbi:DUF4236 domain-containing protein [Streptomyces sp. WMMB 322]|uniref:DUF4236 domain-containing protein n=1 Tax=Streptomyces sp. WMMB 322 TaxID=1286821 RepID=UPI0006E1B5D2|nr:DUF4236 domain-containing protein [Streptomyces sp. WMMB 322]SCK36324.1 Protein of unknown function [Streptomyces sp. WMMB 322]